MLSYHVKLDGQFWVFSSEMTLKGLSMGSFSIVVLVSIIIVDVIRCHWRWSMIVTVVVVGWYSLSNDAPFSLWMLEPSADADEFRCKARS